MSKINYIPSNSYPPLAPIKIGKAEVLFLALNLIFIANVIGVHALTVGHMNAIATASGCANATIVGLCTFYVLVSRREKKEEKSEAPKRLSYSPISKVEENVAVQKSKPTPPPAHAIHDVIMKAANLPNKTTEERDGWALQEIQRLHVKEIYSIDDQKNELQSWDKENIPFDKAQAMGITIQPWHEANSRVIILRDEKLLEERDEQGRTPLYLAVEFKCLRTADYLASCGADITKGQIKTDQAEHSSYTLATACGYDPLASRMRHLQQERFNELSAKPTDGS